MTSSSRSTPGLGFVTRLYRAVLVLYPRTWSAADRADLVDFFRARYRDAWSRRGRRGTLRAAVVGLTDAVASGLAERLSERRHDIDTGREKAGMRETVEGVVRDARVALRSLLRTPGFTAVCVLTLALGIGATTSLFTVLRALVLAPLPYSASEQLVSIRRDLVVRGIDNYPAAPADVIDYRMHSDAFAAIAGLIGRSPIMTERDARERLTAVAATPELFDVLGVQPAFGRGFTPEDGLPSTQQDGAATSMPVVLSDGFWRRRFGADADILGRTLRLGNTTVLRVGEGYFETLRTPVLAGRELTRDDANAEPVRVLVDRVLAERTWPGESPIGKRLYVKVQMPGIWFEVAGMVGHQRHDALTGTSHETIYFPAGYGGPEPSRWAVRFDGDPVAAVPAARAAVARVDDRILLENVQPLSAHLDAARAPTRMITVFVAAFGLLALTLALVGLYGVLAYLVRERRAEFGVRLALGAEAGSILRLVLRHGIALSALGIAAGVAGALALTRIMTGVLVGVAPTDSTTYAAVASLFVLMAAAASLVPARRALAIDPMQILRDQ